LVLGNPAGSICTDVSESVIVYSLRMTWPDELVMTVGAKTCGIGNWVTNFGIVVGLSGTGLGAVAVTAEVFVTSSEVDLSLPQPFDVTPSDVTARTKTAPDATMMRLGFVATFRLLLGVREQPTSYAKKAVRVVRARQIPVDARGSSF
jgi:hypothetical protein